MSLIRFDRVSLQFSSPANTSSIAAVDDCSFEIAAGKLVVILGESGCGKTTLLKLVNRLYEPTAGTIYFNQQPIQQIAPTVLRRQMGYVIQQSGLFPHMTVAQNIAVVPKLLNWKRSRIQARIDELLTLVGLPQYRDRYPAQLSGGQQQRVGLARALAADPSVLLMDEPFGAIDAIARSHLQDELLKLQQQLQKTILFVSHDVEEALKLGDALMLMQGGKIVQYDQPLQILHHPANQFVRSLLGTDDVFRHLGLVSVAMLFDQIDEIDRDRIDRDEIDRNRMDRDKVARDEQSGDTVRGTVVLQDSLRWALSIMVQQGVRVLSVVDSGGDRVGYLTMDQILQRGILFRNEP